MSFDAQEPEENCFQTSKDLYQELSDQCGEQNYKSQVSNEYIMLNDYFF